MQLKGNYFMASQIKGLKPVTEWIELVKEADGDFAKKLDDIFGDDSAQKAKAAEMCLRCLEKFSTAYGSDSSVIISRSSGRVNLLGTHIDHRGGSVNPIAIKQMC